MFAYDQGSRFIGCKITSMILEDYGITIRLITKRNLQANTVIEQIHQVLLNMIHAFNLETHRDTNEP